MGAKLSWKAEGGDECGGVECVSSPHSAAAGVGRSLFPEMVESDVLFTNSAGLYAEPVSEHALAMILYFARGLDVAAAGPLVRGRSGSALGPPSPASG